MHKRRHPFLFFCFPLHVKLSFSSFPCSLSLLLPIFLAVDSKRDRETFLLFAEAAAATLPPLPQSCCSSRFTHVSQQKPADSFIAIQHHHAQQQQQHQWEDLWQLSFTETLCSSHLCRGSRRSTTAAAADLSVYEACMVQGETSLAVLR